MGVGKAVMKLATLAFCGAMIAPLAACGFAAPRFPIVKIERMTAIKPAADPALFRITLANGDLAKIISDPHAVYIIHDCAVEDGHVMEDRDFTPEPGGAAGALLLRIPLNYDRDKNYRCGHFETRSGHSGEVRPPGPWPGPFDEAPAKSPP